jgi:hypothetical protein
VQMNFVFVIKLAGSSSEGFIEDEAFTRSAG